MGGKGRERRVEGDWYPLLCVFCAQVSELARSDALVRVRESYSTALEQSSQQHHQQVLALQQELDTAQEHVERQVCVCVCVLCVCVLSFLPSPPLLLFLLPYLPPLPPFLSPSLSLSLSLSFPSSFSPTLRSSHPE